MSRISKLAKKLDRMPTRELIALELWVLGFAGLIIATLGLAGIINGGG